MAQLVTRVGDDLLAAVDQLVTDGVLESRSDAVRRGLRHLVDEQRRRRTAEAIVAGYRARPQRLGDVGWSDEATTGMIADEPW